MTKLHSYQQAALDFMLDRFFVEQEIGAYLAADTGVGKTLIILKLIEWLKQLGEVRRVMIIAPLQVVHNVWVQEAEKHNIDLDMVVCHGTEAHRRDTLRSDADVFLINYESLQWLENNLPRRYDLLVLDESTKIKTWVAKRSRALRRMIRNDKFRWRICMSGTPSPRSYGDLHAQYYVVDNGEALGQTLRWFRQRYMWQGVRGRFFEWTFRVNMTGTLLEQIAPMTFRIDAEDYLDLPDLLYNDQWITLPPEAMLRYQTMERELFLALATGQTLTANGAGAKYALCREVANGGIYETLDDDTRVSHFIHDEKIQAAKNIVLEAAGKPVMIAYSYDMEREVLLRNMPRGTEAIYGGCTPARTRQLIRKWNEDRLPVLLVQPQALSHGVNMQYGSGRDVVFFSIPDQLEAYQQLIARVYRQGVQGQVRVHHILARGTVDIAVRNRLDQKRGAQVSLLRALNEYRMTRQ